MPVPKTIFHLTIIWLFFFDSYWPCIEPESCCSADCKKAPSSIIPHLRLFYLCAEFCKKSAEHGSMAEREKKAGLKATLRPRSKKVVGMEKGNKRMKGNLNWKTFVLAYSGGRILGSLLGKKDVYLGFFFRSPSNSELPLFTSRSFQSVLLRHSQVCWFWRITAKSKLDSYCHKTLRSGNWDANLFSLLSLVRRVGNEKSKG